MGLISPLRAGSKQNRCEEFTCTTFILPICSSSLPSPIGLMETLREKGRIYIYIYIYMYKRRIYTAIEELYRRYRRDGQRHIQNKRHKINIYIYIYMHIWHLSISQYLYAMSIYILCIYIYIYIYVCCSREALGTIYVSKMPESSNQVSHKTLFKTRCMRWIE